MKKIILTISIIAVILIGAFLLFGWFSQRAVNSIMAGLETETVQQGTLSSTVGASGVVQSNQSAYLVWKVSGQVGEVLTNTGDKVTAGDTLARLDNASLPAYMLLAQVDLVNAQDQLDTLLNSSTQRAKALKAVEDARQALEDARNPEVAQAEALAAIAAAEADLKTAQTQLEIITNPVSQEAIDQASANLILTENRLNKTLESIRKIEQKRLKLSATKLPAKFRREIMGGYKQALEGLEFQRTQNQLSYDRALAKYNSLIEPPDPLDKAVAEAAVFAAQAQLDDANLQYDRIKDGVSPAEIAVLEAELAEAQREYERVKNGAPEDDIAVLEAQIAASEATLQQSTLTAPFDGTITLVDIQPGDQVSAGTIGFRLDDLSTLKVGLDVSEIDINLVQLGQEVVITFDAILAKEYHGKVTDIAPVGTVDDGITSFKVLVELYDADEEVRPGITSEVNIITNQLENTLMIPNRAIRLLNGERVVYVLPDAATPKDGQSALNSIVPVVVSLGASSDLYSQVLSGDLSVGDIVVLNPPSDGIASINRGGVQIEFQGP